MELMPGYKYSDVGVIPEDWDVRNLGSLGRVIRGASPRPKGDRRFYGGNIPRLMVEDVTRDGKHVTPQVDFLTEEGAKRSRPCPKGTLTVVCSGTVGIPSFLNVDACIHDGFLALINLNQSIDADYLFHQLTSFQQKFDSTATHGGVFTNLTTSGFGDFKVPVASVPEQKAISIVLSDVDAMLATLDQLINKKRDLKQAAMQQLLTGKTRLPGFSEDWEVTRLGDVASFFKGKGLPKSAISESGAEPCIHYGELFTRHPETIGEIYSRTDSFAGAFRSVSNDVLMPTSDVTPRGLAKASCITSDDVILGGDILVIRSDIALICGSFLSFLIRYEEAKILKLVTGSTVYHLYGSDMEGFTFSMPSLPEQAAIVAVLSGINAELSVLEARRDKTRNIKQAMMQELLTGKTRLV